MVLHGRGALLQCIDGFNGKEGEEAKAWLVRCMREGMEEFLKEVPVVVEAEIKSTW